MYFYPCTNTITIKRNTCCGNLPRQGRIVSAAEIVRVKNRLTDIPGLLTCCGIRWFKVRIVTIEMPIKLAIAWIDATMTPTAIAVYCLAALLVLAAFVALFLLWTVHAERTRLARARQQLDRQQAYTQSLLDALPFPVAVKDRDGAYLMLNSACRHDIDIGTDAIGETSLALPGRGLFAIEGEIPANRLFHESSLEVVQAGRERQREITYTGNDGSHRTGLWWDCPVLVANDDGVAGSLGVLLDITRFRQIEQEARAAERSLREICQHIRDANGHYLFVVKDNQPELKANIAESFGDLSPLRSRPLRSQRGGARGRIGGRVGRAA